MGDTFGQRITRFQNIMAYSETKLFSLMATMPAFPNSGYALLQLTNDINCPPKEVVRVIDRDPILTMHLLKLVNSEYFGLAKKITSIKEAVVFLGINTIKNLALGIVPLELLAISETPYALTDILRHSLAVAIIARKLARNLGFSQAQATDCYVAGLLHDFGKLALFKLLPDDYGPLLKREATLAMPFTDLEKKTVSTTHTAVGELLGRKWGLPELIIQSMAGHHDATFCASSPLLDCIFAANLIAQKVGSVHTRMIRRDLFLPADMVARFGKDLDSLTASLGLIADEIEHTLLLTTIQGDGSMTSATQKS